jgi:putative endonuclease
MAEHNDLGELGESIAREFYESQGYRIVETKWRVKRAEVDLIVEKNQVYVFVEVKCRKTSAYTIFEPTLSEKKEAFMAYAANAWIELTNHEGAIRFDFIAIQITPSPKPIIKHYPDFFFPGLE